MKKLRDLFSDLLGNKQCGSAFRTKNSMNHASELEYYKKLDECLAKFKNGKELYRRSPMFNIVIQQLVRGVDPYEVIEQLCIANADIQMAFEQYALRDERPMVMGDYHFVKKP